MKANNNKYLSFIKNNFADIFIVFLILYCSNDTLLFGTNSNRLMFWIHIAVLGFLALYLLISTKKISKQMILLVLSIATLNVLDIVFNNDLSIKYAYEMIMVFIGLLVAKKMNINKFKECFCVCMDAICFVSIIIFIIAFLYPRLISYLPTIINESGIKYHFALFTLIETVGYSYLPRVYGIFREPGVFMIFISLAMLFEILFTEKYSIKRFVIYVVCLLITFSTAAYFSLLLLFLILVLKSFKLTKLKTGKRNLLILIILLISIISFVSIIGIDKIDKFVFNKLRVDNTSYDSRVGSIFGNLNIFVLNPIFGKGFTFAENNFTNYALMSGYANAHNTNTLLKILAVHGVFYWIIVTVGLIKFFFNKKYLLVSVLSFVTLVIILSNEDLIVNTLLYVIVCFGYFSNIKEKLNECSIN